jgi:hypothetical protein
VTEAENAFGYLRVMFAVDDIDETLERLRKRTRTRQFQKSQPRGSPGGKKSAR